MHELERFHIDRTNICFYYIEAKGEGWDPVNLHLGHQKFIIDRSNAVLSL